MNAIAKIVVCPHCQARYRIDVSKADRDVVSIRCPKCARIFPLPLAPEAGRPQIPVPVPAAGGNRKVLIVDDAKFFREVLVDILKPLALICLTAASADEAWTVLRRERPALLLLDLNLPGKSGHELIREVRADAVFAGTKILAMSGVFRDEADIVAVTAAGADDFISKSFKPEQLHFRINKLLAG